MKNEKNKMNMLSGVLLFLTFLTALSAFASANTLILTPNSTVNHAYYVSSTNSTDPNNATSEFSSAQYINVGSPDITYAISVAQESIIQTCRTPDEEGCEDPPYPYMCGREGYQCTEPTCDAPVPWCNNLPNSVWSSSCAPTMGGLRCICKQISREPLEFMCMSSGICGKTGSCSYTCTAGYYDTDTTDSNGCESTTVSYVNGFQRYTFNMSEVPLQNITAISLCWEGYYSSTQGASGANLEWYNTSGAWVNSTPVQQSERTYCLSFSGSSLKDIYNTTDNSSQFALAANQTRDGYANTIYANYAYINISYLSGATLVEAKSPASGSAVFQRTVNFSYNVTSYQFRPTSCSLFDSVHPGNPIVASNATPLVNNSINNITYTYSQDNDSISWYIQCFDSGSNPSTQPPFTLTIHTSTINTYDASLPTQCANESINIYCNYTDGNLNKITGATVYIGTNRPGYSELHTNDTSIVSPPPGYNTVTHDISYDPLKGYYAVVMPDTAAVYSYNCSASKYAYPFNSTSPPHKFYTIQQPSDVNLTVNVTPPSPVNYGTNVNFSGNYTNMSDGAFILGADCKLITIGSSFPAEHKTSPDRYLANTTGLPVFSNGWRFECQGVHCFQPGVVVGTYTILYSGTPSSPTLIFEDPLYSLNTQATTHRVISASPYTENLVVNISSCVNASNWTYGMVVKPALENPVCSGLPPTDKSKILLVKNSTNIDTVNCPELNGFAGVIFEDDYCDRTGHTCAFTVPYAYNFTSPVYDKIPNYAYVLINGDYFVVQDISKLRDFYSNGYYRVSNYAPSFLMRLSGNLAPSPYGIESLVKLGPVGQNNSSVDYYYFSNPPLIPYKIKGMPNCENASVCNDTTKKHFFLDNQIGLANASGNYTHLQLYGATTLVYSSVVRAPQCPPESCSTNPDCPCPGDPSLVCCDPFGSCKNNECTLDFDCSNPLYCGTVTCDRTTCPSRCKQTPYPCNHGNPFNPPIHTCCPVGSGCNGDTNDPNYPTYYDTNCPNTPQLPPNCGTNGICDSDETAENCPQDCCLPDCSGIDPTTYYSDGICHSECSTVPTSPCALSFKSACDNAPVGSTKCSDGAGYPTSFTHTVTCCTGPVTSCSPGTCNQGSCSSTAGDDCWTPNFVTCAPLDVCCPCLNLYRAFGCTHDLCTARSECLGLAPNGQLWCVLYQCSDPT